MVGPERSSLPAPAPLLSIRNLCKRFGDRMVLKDVSFEIGAGEAVVLIGPSGSGKTTVLRCLNQLETPTSGTITLAGDVIGGSLAPDGTRWKPFGEADIAGQRRRFGFVFQRFNLFPHLCALQNVALGPRLTLGLLKATAEARAAAHLERVRLADHRDKRPGQLSGGQQQRVAIARALAMEPELILFDEPTSALDPELVHEVLDVMRALARDGMTMIVVTHEMSFARQVAHRVVFMADGAIVEQGAPDALFTAPQHETTRRFLAHVRNR